MRTLIGIFVAGLFSVSAGMATAQPLGIGTTKGGANAAIGGSIAKIVSSKSGAQMRPQKMGGTQQYIPLVNAGKVQFGLSNVMQYYMAVTGTGLSAGKPNKNLRLAATLMPFRNGIIVRADSGINSIADLKGKRVPSGFKAAPLFDTFLTAFLKNGGLSWNDVKRVPVVSLPQSWGLFKAGKIDAAVIAAGAGPLRAIKAKVGEVKFLPIANDPATLKMLPRTRFQVVKPNARSIALKKPTNLHVYDYVMFASASTANEDVYRVVKAIHENVAALRKTTPFWKAFRAKNIARDQQLAYHPGALKYFREKGLIK